MAAAVIERVSHSIDGQTVSVNGPLPGQMGHNSGLHCSIDLSEVPHTALIEASTVQTVLLIKEGLVWISCQNILVYILFRTKRWLIIRTISIMEEDLEWI